MKYTLAAKLVNEFVEAADEKVLAKTIARYGRGDLLRIDELGHMKLLFQVLTECEETNSVANCFLRIALRLDQDVHRAEALRRNRRPARLRHQHRPGVMLEARHRPRSTPLERSTEDA